ncbi:ribonuclease H-like domain-containing protein [Tanacetum coccineum]
MTYTDNELDNVLDIFHLKIKVSHPNGTEAFISEIGNLELSNGLVLYDVLVIPEHCVSLISVHKLAKENKIIHDWYYRLGHPAEPVLNVLQESLQFDDKNQNVYCEICQRAKQTREPFPLSDHTSKFLGDIVHLDLWGPYKVTSSKRDVKFFEDIFPFKDFITGKNDSNVFQDINHLNFLDVEYPELPNDDERVEPKLNSDQRSQSVNSSSFVSDEDANTTDFLVNSGNDADSSDNFFATQNEEVTTLKENIFSDGNLDLNPRTFAQGVQAIRISSRHSVFPKNYNDFVIESKFKYGHEKHVGYSKLNSEIFCFVTQLNKNNEPKSFLEASKYPHWTDAMNQEMDALLRNGIDYEETSSLVVKMVTVRCLLNIVVSKSWHVFQLDVNNAFLYGDLVETVYMRPPEGYFPSENDFSQSKSDYSLYTKSDKGVFLALLVYVDDIIITSNNIYEIEMFKVYLKSKFMIKDLGKLIYFLGIEVIDTDKGICLNKRRYVLDLLSEYGMLACKPAKTPLMSKLIISNEAVLDKITDY